LPFPIGTHSTADAVGSEKQEWLIMLAIGKSNVIKELSFPSFDFGKVVEFTESWRIVMARNQLKLA
jgi:hypothetical protein